MRPFTPQWVWLVNRREGKLKVGVTLQLIQPLLLLLHLSCLPQKSMATGCFGKHHEYLVFLTICTYRIQHLTCGLFVDWFQLLSCDLHRDPSVQDTTSLQPYQITPRLIRIPRALLYEPDLPDGLNTAGSKQQSPLFTSS